MLKTQDPVYLSILTPLGKDVLVLKHFSGVERLSNPFKFEMSMISQDYSLDFDALVGQEATVTIEWGEQTRYFHGNIGELLQGYTDFHEDEDTTFYFAKLYPKFWQLKFTKDCRIFQNLSTLDIVTQVLQENGVTDFQDQTQSRGKATREYCVQFNESCFDFISRLLEEEGICYFFEHSAGGHKMILADSIDVYKPCEVAQVQLEVSRPQTPVMNKLTGCSIKQSVVPRKHDIADFNYKTPSIQLFSTLEGKGNKGKVYEYPGLFQNQGEGEGDVKIFLEGDEWPQKHIEGTSTIASFSPGFTTEIQGLPREDANKVYTLFQVEHSAKLRTKGEDVLYKNKFIGFDSDVIFRPQRKTQKPLISGTQTAFVTGKSGEEIWTDEFGRIKVQFHWDREGKHDETSSCWVRVAQSWASNNWGVLFTPRIGQEVVVSFVNGDPDRPLVTGCVYNADSMPPYLPNEPTKSTIKTNSSLGGGGYNEIRFEDLKGSEEIYVQAEKDKNVLIKNNLTTDVLAFEKRTVGKDRTTEIKGDEEHTNQQNHTQTIVQNRTITVQGDEVHTNNKNLTHTIDETCSVTVTGDESHTNSANYTHAVTEDYKLTIDGNLEITVAGDITINGKSMALTTETTTTLESGEETSVKAGTDIDIEGVNITSKASSNLKGEGSVVDMKSSGVAKYVASGVTEVKGAIVKVN